MSRKQNLFKLGLARVQTLCYNKKAVCGSISSADENEKIHGIVIER